MKRLGILGVFILTIYIGFASAAVCTTSDQTILSLYSNSNSHASLWNDSNAQIKVCYDEIFGTKYTNSNMQTCTSSNTVLKLDSFSNAHAEGPSGSLFNTNVCYGDLNCRVVPVSTTKNNNECEVLGLYSQTNSHLSKTVSSGYKLLCSSQFAGNSPNCGQITEEEHMGCVVNSQSGLPECVLVPGAGSDSCTTDLDCTTSNNNQVGNVEWQNAGGQKIYSAGVNDTVYLTAYTGYNNNTQIIFDVYDKNTVIPDSKIANFSSRTDANGKATKAWHISDYDYAAGLFYRVFYFVASGPNSTNTSMDLNVSASESTPSAPVINITKPLHRQMYFTNTPIEFNQTSYSPTNRPLTYNWTIIHNGEIEIYNSAKSFTYTFPTNSTGQRTIILTVFDAEDRNVNSKKEVSILLLGNAETLAYINDPPFEGMINNESFNVYYSANDSYVVNSLVNTASCTGNITCLAGYCPIQTINSPLSCASIPVYNFSIDGTPKGFNNLIFNWTFLEKGNNNFKVNYIGNVEGRVSYGSPSAISSPISYDKIMRLLLSYNDGVISSNSLTEREFHLSGYIIPNQDDHYECSLNGVVHVVDQQNIGIQNYTEYGNCKVPFGNSLTDCCTATDASQQCDSNAKKCVLRPVSTPQVLGCSIYDRTSESQCEGAPESVYEQDRALNYPSVNCGSTTIDGQAIQCSCIWTSNQTCKFNYKNVPVQNPACSTSCIYSDSDLSECVDGRQQKQQNTQFIGPSSSTCDMAVVTAKRDLCLSDNQQVYDVECGAASVELPIFGWWQFALTILGLCLIYTIRKKVNFV